MESELCPELPRCRWCRKSNPLYVKYHDEEWGTPPGDDRALCELFLLETFQAGLSWEVVLNKREHFREAFDGFDLEKISAYGEEKLTALQQDPGLIRNRRKLEAAVTNSRILRSLQKEFGSFDGYLRGFTNGETVRENDPGVTASPLSDRISKDLKRRGMKFVGSVTIYAFLQAIGVVQAHEECCFRFRPGP